LQPNVIFAIIFIFILIYLIILVPVIAETHHCVAKPNSGMSVTIKIVWRLLTCLLFTVFCCHQKQ